MIRECRPCRGSDRGRKSESVPRTEHVHSPESVVAKRLVEHQRILHGTVLSSVLWTMNVGGVLRHELVRHQTNERRRVSPSKFFREPRCVVESPRMVMTG